MDLEDTEPHFCKRACLTIVTEDTNQIDPTFGEEQASTTPTSLFTASDSGQSDLQSPERMHILAAYNEPARMRASRAAPPIPGLYFTPAIRLPSELAEDIMDKCMDTYFRGKDINQVMLFGRVASVDIPLRENDAGSSGDCPGHDTTGLPPFLVSLLSTLEQLLMPVLPSHTHSLLFPPRSAPMRARQAILNLYLPGEGISAHVDLLQRFGDGILGLSLGSGCVMRFQKENPKPPDNSVWSAAHLKSPGLAQGQDCWDLYLPERSVLVLSEEARYDWKHSIEAKLGDLVESEADGEIEKASWIARGMRLSITFRWLLPGADVVGT
jgi:hypothetical protein